MYAPGLEKLKVAVPVVSLLYRVQKKVVAGGEQDEVTVTDWPTVRVVVGADTVHRGAPAGVPESVIEPLRTWVADVVVSV